MKWVAGCGASPTSDDARRIAREVFGEQAASCERFTTGLRHWVFDVVLAESHRQVVVRLSHPDHRDELAGGVFWHRRLSDVGVPVAPILASDTSAEQPFMILERLAGTDIGNVIDDMSHDQVRGAALAVVEMQHNAARLPRADGFGYALDDQQPLHPSWTALLHWHLERSRTWITAAGLVNVSWADRVAELLERRSLLMEEIAPVAFLHDATTKNVIVHEGRVTGLVDVDQTGFGDPLWAPALTRASLLASGRRTDYADIQLAVLARTGAGSDLIDLYTALHCLAFLGEIGQTFNRDDPAAIDESARRHLESVLATLL